MARQHVRIVVISEGQGGSKYRNSWCSVKMLSRQRYSYSYSPN